MKDSRTLIKEVIEDTDKLIVLVDMFNLEKIPFLRKKLVKLHTTLKELGGELSKDP